jgi:large subunit ribosomal protein L3
VAPKKVLKECRFEDTSMYNVGDIIKADVFENGEKVDVIGTSKGKGYAGVIKRWNFRRLKETHGSGPVVRKGGSIGACSDPSRVYKGKKMSGHLGAEKVTVQNLKVAKIDVENNLIAIKGAVPGPNGGIVLIRDSVKA